MNKRILTGALVGVAALTACGEGESVTRTDTTSVPGQLVQSVDLGPSEACEAGGTLLQSGTDDNQNGSLESSEVDTSYNICNGVDVPGINGRNAANGEDGANGAAGLNLLSATDAATDCPSTGIVVSFGLDDDANGTLSAEEVDSSTTLCDGGDAADACAPVMRITPIGAELGCTEGGVLVSHGEDSGNAGAGGAGGAASEACDGILSDGEVAQSQVICNGETGAQGAVGDQGDQGDQGAQGDQGERGDTGNTGVDGYNQLTKITVVADSAACLGGGFMVESGWDTNSNTSLDAGEVTATTHICADDADGDGVANGTDNCANVANPAQIDQDDDGEGDLCDSTPCVGDSCAANCSMVQARGFSTDGHYAIDPSGSAAFPAYCDMTTDGGGWTLVLNYVHQRGNNSALSFRSSDLPLLNAHSRLGDNEAGSEFWGHANNAMFASLDVDQTRFAAETTAHSRELHFYTSACNDYFATGSGNCAGINTDHTDLGGHTGLIPDAVANYYSNRGQEAMTRFPFWLSGRYHWGVRGNGNRWEVDDYARNTASTWHRVYVRSLVTQKSCLDHLLEGNTDDDVYPIDPDGPGGLAPFNVYCDQSTDGGGWAKILQYVDGSYVPDTGVIGTIADSANTADAKLSDAQVNALRNVNGDGLAVYRQDGINATAYGYLKSPEAFDDGAAAWGFGVVSATMQACLSTDLAGCSYKSVTTNHIDHLHYGTGGFETWNRLFTGHAPYTGCYQLGTTHLVNRCVSGGASTTPNYLGHPSFILWMRPKIYESCAEAATAGEPAGDTAIDADGVGAGAPAIVTCP